MFEALLIALAAAIGVNCTLAAYEDWLDSSGWSYVIRDGVMGLAGLAAAVAGIVEVIA
jgi:hypothetical protein